MTFTLGSSKQQLILPAQRIHQIAFGNASKISCCHIQLKNTKGDGNNIEYYDLSNLVHQLT